MDFMTLIQLLDSTVRLATPLLLACLAGLFSERAGIFDIGLEGKMLAAAFFSAAIAALTGSVWLGLAAGLAASIALSLLHGLASITFRGNQLISGVAINFLAAGLTVLIAQDWFQQGGRTPSLMGGARFEPITLPFAGSLSGVPIFGPIYSELISGHSILVYIAFAMVPLTWWVLYRTRFGLRLRAVGENPAAVDTAGVSVVGLRYAAVIICGVLCGIAGAYLSTALAGGLRQGHVGRARFHSPCSPHLRQVASLVRTLCHLALWALRRARNPSRCHRSPDRHEGSGPASGGAALYHDGDYPCRFRGQGDPAARGRRAIRQGKMIE